ncbi:Hsp70 protein that interacts with Zuo1p, partial [Ceratobasidium sp. UAMH 11750]
LLAKGCATQALLVLKSQNDPFAQSVSAPVTKKALGLVFAGDEESWVSIAPAETPLPCRRSIRLSVPAGQIGFELWEAVDTVNVEKIKPEQDEDDEEEPEEEEIRTRVTKKENALGGCVVDVKGSGKKGGKVVVQVVVSETGKVDVSAWEEGKGEKVGFSVGA